MHEAHLSSVSAAGQYMPLVTVGVPTYNRPEGLRKALEWILKQTYTNLEIIVSDNCSTINEVQQIMAAFAAKDSRVRVFRQPENMGLENNFNFVYQESTAGYFIWMSDDDFFEENYVEECVKVLETNADCVLCSGIAKYFRGNEFLFDENMLPVTQRTAVQRLLYFFSRMEKNGKFYGVFRKNLLSDNPLSKTIGCDWNFLAKLAVLGKMTYTPKTCYHRSVEGHSASRKKMIDRFGFKGLKALFFESYAAYTISTNIFTDKCVRNKFNSIARPLLVTAVFFQIQRLQIVNSIKKRLGYKKS